MGAHWAEHCHDEGLLLTRPLTIVFLVCVCVFGVADQIR